ncbi:MAG TPA: hypothetical protein VFE60_12470 [Roseiarcus sp.]|nr:hypothetical protein [Roseiarcus sp.]
MLKPMIDIALGAGIVALIAVATGAWHFLGANRFTAVEAPSVAVLPFDNLSGDEQASRLADLTRFRGAIATSLNGMMTFLVAVIAFSYLSRRAKGPAPMSKQVLTRLWSECTLPAWMPCPYIHATRPLPKLALSYAGTMLYYL